MSKGEGHELVPSLRFPEFRSEVGWYSKPLAEIADIQLGKMLDKKKQSVGTSHPYLNNLAVRWNDFDVNDLPEMSFAEHELEKFSVDVGDVLVCEGGEPGRAAVWDGRLSGIKYQKALHRVRLIDDYLPQLLVHYLETIAGTQYFESLFTGGGIQHLTRQTIAQLPIPIPSSAEQYKIAECLGSLDDWIAAETDALAALRRHKTGLLQQLFPRPGETRPRLRFPEFKEGPAWDTPAMSDVYEFNSTNSLSRDQLNYEAGVIYNIHYGDIHTKFQTQFCLESERVPRIIPEVAEELGDRFHLCHEGDIILADASEDLNDVGKAIELISLGGQRVVSGTHTIHATRLGDKPSPGFGGYLFQSAAVRRGIQKEAQGAKVYGISPTRIASVPLPMPRTTNEQSKIAECLGSLDAQIFAKSETLAGLREHKRGLMQQLFPAPDTSGRGG